jgi:hypothetical protein
MKLNTKLLAFLAVVAGILALGTEQQQATSIIQTRNTEGVWSEALLGPSGFETSVNSQVANRLVVIGVEDIWQNPLTIPPQPIAGSIQLPAPTSTTTFQPTTSALPVIPTSTLTPDPSPEPTSSSNTGSGSGGNTGSGDGGIFNTEVLIAVISTIGVIVAAYLGYLGARAARRH